MKVTIYGIGYVGLVQAAALASVGHNVMCVDIDEIKISDLRSGIIPIHEPGLSTLINKAHKQNLITFTTHAQIGVKHSSIQIIAVGTPAKSTGEADLQYVLSVAQSIALYMESPQIIVNKSTVPVGTTDKIHNTISTVLLAREQSFNFQVVSNPEFLKEGAAVNDCLRPERIILGTCDQESITTLSALYAPFNRSRNRIITMDVRSAELTKYAANCMLATKISFMNEMANIAERMGADIESVRQGIGADSRIGYQFIYPGCGYGGSCFPKDIKALIHSAHNLDYQPHILEAVEAINEQQKQKLFSYLALHFSHDLMGKTVAIWGLAFKPETDDVREAPAITLIRSLLKAGAKIQAYDPEANAACHKIFGLCENLNLVNNAEQALNDADALVICTEWGQFRTPDFDLIKQKLNYSVIIDGRNLYDDKLLTQKGFSYYAIGRGDSIKRNMV
ncbi:UDP-glucose/GDP-mannose dehydrogenase family protein [Colwellia sp. MB3u-4]|uniref:UDP-glucose dehydrogenase family protein n=1 Tax=Colwellia sp. MB3u-4 TaxID=2759822 RepID=UPI0015F37219|nr:UDP-glucose/GDP-mannose dehydrogenase family protein [Colwellia sp. MB3u-4]MBA6290217.1 UDP-glucose/GDP-mannose dehydrogenase family protein [Colwellia sp. MB3u-4]